MEQIPVKQLHESPFNPRRTAGPLGELVASVKRHGILQPLIARMVGDELELVIGHRRLRAAKEAGLAKVPVEVRTLSNEEAREIQLVENVQREDIHPMEEAEGYEALHTEFGYSNDEIADRIGKSKSWVYARVKLLDLNEEGRKAFYRGDLNPTTALLIARLKTKGERVQDAGLRHITQKNRWGDVMPAREAAAAMKRLLEEEATPAKKATQLAGAKLVRMVRERTRDFALREIVARVEKKAELQPADLRLALTARISDGVPASVLRRRGVETAKQLERKVATASAAELRGLLIELELSPWVDDESDVTGTRLKVMCKAYDLEHREIEQTVRELLAKEEQTGKADALFAKTR